MSKPIAKEVIYIHTINRLKKGFYKPNHAFLIENEKDFEYSKAYNGHFQFIIGDCYSQSYYPDTNEKRECIYPENFDALVELYIDFCEKLSIELTGSGFDFVFTNKDSDYKYQQFIQDSPKMGCSLIDCRKMRTVLEDNKETSVQVAFVFGS